MQNSLLAENAIRGERLLNHGTHSELSQEKINYSSIINIMI